MNRGTGRSKKENAPMQTIGIIIWSQGKVYKPSTSISRFLKNQNDPKLIIDIFANSNKNLSYLAIDGSNRYLKVING